MNGSAVEDTLKTLEGDAIEFMNKYALSGMAIGIVQDGKLIYAKGFGLADASTNTAVTPDTIFRIGSISKTFTAIGIMQLWEKGKFKLDDPVNNFLKSFQVLHPDPYAPPVTFEHLLTHTSGIGEMRSTGDLVKSMIMPRRSFQKLKKHVPSLQEYFNGLLVPDVYPEKKWAYANNAFATLGQLIEDITGEPFVDYMRRNVFDALGMHKSDYTLTDRVADELAQGYILKKCKLEAVPYVEFPGYAAGTVMSSVNEMAIYLAALMNGGTSEFGSVLKPETLKKMLTAYYQEDAHLASMGLGFFLENLDGHPAVWHGGALPGFNAAMWVAPEDKLGVVAFANSNTRAIYSFAERVLRGLIGLEKFSERLPRPDVPSSPYLWKEFIGTFGLPKGFNSNARAWENFGGEIEIYVKDQKLMLRSLTGAYKKGIELYPVDVKDPLVFENVTDGKLLQLAFQRNVEGYIDRFSISSLSFYTFYRKPRTRSLRFMLKTAQRVLMGLAAWMIFKKMKKRKYAR
jgi:CubicO group peptidase (beta-lactamase class C family)